MTITTIRYETQSPRGVVTSGTVTGTAFDGWNRSQRTREAHVKQVAEKYHGAYPAGVRITSIETTRT